MNQAGEGIVRVRNEGVIVTGGGTIHATNLAVGSGARIVDRHVTSAPTMSHEIAADPEIAEAAAYATSQTANLQEWAGADRATLAIVFTDVVNSTALGQQLRDEAFRQVRLAHFARSRQLIAQFRGLEIKTIGDSFMAVFKSADPALDYAMALQADSGDPLISIRAGIHVGSIDVEAADVFGGEVNFAARVIGKIAGAEIWISDRARKDLEVAGVRRHASLAWQRHEGIAVKGFEGEFVLWSLQQEKSR
jgi:class 3 adenylate cyclase